VPATPTPKLTPILPSIQVLSKKKQAGQYLLKSSVLLLTVTCICIIIDLTSGGEYIIMAGVMAAPCMLIAAGTIGLVKTGNAEGCLGWLCTALSCFAWPIMIFWAAVFMSSDVQGHKIG
jgi:hypothetical protein